VSRSGKAARRLPISRDLGGKAAAGSLATYPQQALLGGSANRGRDGFTGEQGEFAYRFFRRGILDVERHTYTLAEYFC
jgi:hypothetical protein